MKVSSKIFLSLSVTMAAGVLGCQQNPPANKAEETASRLVAVSSMPTKTKDAPMVCLFDFYCRAWDVIFVCDRSGSTLDKMDLFKSEIITSISNLSTNQNFHLIFFSEGDLIEMEPAGLKPAKDEYKEKAVEFVKNIESRGTTKSTPAVKKALKILGTSNNTRKVIYLLTDGKLDDPSQVIEVINNENKTNIVINTILCGRYDEQAEEVLQEISRLGGGKYIFIDTR